MRRSSRLTSLTRESSGEGAEGVGAAQKQGGDGAGGVEATGRDVLGHLPVCGRGGVGRADFAAGNALYM